MSIFTRYFLNKRAKIGQLLPPQSCVLCGAVSNHTSAWCAACDAGMPHLYMPLCPICALPSPLGAMCGHCIKTPPHFNRTVAVFGYTFPLDKLIQALKYGERLELAHSFADQLAQHIIIRPDSMIAMPLHPARLQERGFNQSLELARRLEKKLHIPVLTNVCERVRDTPPQSTLSRNARNKNMQQAFACTKNFSTQDLSGQHIAIVDDVMTSGASLNEVARVLRAAGASEVSAWVIARTLPR